MIGKVTSGKSFGGCLRYCLQDKVADRNEEEVMKDRAEVLLYNKCSGDEKELIQQFNEVRLLNPKLSKPVLHITLSLATGERLSKDKLMEMCEQCSKDLGFQHNQFIAIAHRDTHHQHIHIVANRIGFDKRTVSDSNNYQKMAAYCRKMELKYNLQQVLSPRRFLSQEMRQLPRYDGRKEVMKDDVRQCLLASKSYSEFEEKMKQRGYQVVKGRGIAFIDSKGVYAKGSELGYSLQKIEKIVELSMQQKQALLVRQDQNNLLAKTSMKTGHAPAKVLSEDIPKDGYQAMNTQPNKILEDLLRPNSYNQNVPFQLLKKSKKRKRSQHL